MSHLNNSARVNRYRLVNAAHEFLLQAFPIRHPETRSAADRFVETANSCRVSVPHTRAILLDVLSIIQRHTGLQWPSLVDRYLEAWDETPVSRFQVCLNDALKNRGVGSRHVQAAIRIIEERYARCTLTQAQVAEAVALAPSELSAQFKRHTGETFTDHLRRVRLDAAARLLATTGLRIKEVWAAVGYNDASNFDHRFRQRFGTTPREYRHTAHTLTPETVPTQTNAKPTLSCDGGEASMLIVDDNVHTLETLGRHFRSRGYKVSLASTGSHGLDAIDAHDPLVVLLDYNLPDMDGVQRLKAWRVNREARAKVLLFTADWDAADHIDEIQTLGATFLSKLCDIDELEQRIAILIADTIPSSACSPTTSN